MLLSAVPVELTASGEVHDGVGAAQRALVAWSVDAAHMTTQLTAALDALRALFTPIRTHVAVPTSHVLG